MCALVSNSTIYEINLQEGKARAVFKGDDFNPFYTPWSSSLSLETFAVKSGRNICTILDYDFEPLEIFETTEQIKQILSIGDLEYLLVGKTKLFRVNIEEKNMVEILLPKEYQVFQFISNF